MMAALATTVMTVGELLGAVPPDVGGIQITDLVSDSRQVQPGAAFVAVSGERSHGLDYAEEAIRKGAVVVLFEPEPQTGPDKERLGTRRAPLEANPASGVEESTVPRLAVPDLSVRLGELARRFYRLGEQGPRLAGFTGTNGKSTVAYLVAQAQTLRGYPCAYVGTIGAGVPPTLTTQTLTTPDCLSLHRTLASFKTDFAATEVSSHALAQDRVAGLTFDTAVFTNLTRDHLDYHADVAEYQAAKARLFTLHGLRHAVVFVDDSFGETLARGLAESIERIDVSLESDRGIRGTLTASGLQGVTIEISGALVDEVRGTGVITSPLIGDFNAENLVLALGVLLTWNVPVDEACEVLSRCQPPPGRMEILGGVSDQPTVVVDYAHTPAGLERVLSNLRKLVGADLWCVFGCGGERDTGKRPLMGAVAARFADHIVLTDDNPRGEDPGEIIAAIRAAIIDHPNVWIEHDRARAIRDAVLKAGAGDIVLVAGKGHEAWQWVAGESRPFSDRAVVKAALGGQA